MFVRRLIPFSIYCFVLLASLRVAVAEQIQMRKIPVAKGVASHPVNGGHCLISDGEYQYIAFYDGEHQMTVGKRKLGETEWDLVKSCRNGLDGTRITGLYCFRTEKDIFTLQLI